MGVEVKIHSGFLLINLSTNEFVLQYTPTYIGVESFYAHYHLNIQQIFPLYGCAFNNICLLKSCPYRDIRSYLWV